MGSLQINKLEQLINQARQALSSAQTMLQEVFDESTPMDPSQDSTWHGIQKLQLILQYRLDTQNTLAKLLQIDNGLLQILGIAPQHSSKVNIERMEFALGATDFHHVLYSLSQLIRSLSLIVSRYQQTMNKMTSRAPQSSLLTTASHPKLQKAVALQKLFLLSLTEINHQLDQENITTEISPVLDHIAALRGPVSHFFQAVQNGLELTHDLYEKTYETVQLDNTLEALLHQAKHVLQHMPPMYQPQHFFTQAQEHNEDKEDKLEQRASNRRLKQFFHH